MQSDILLAPFKLIWENLPPEWAIPIMGILAIAVLVSFGNLMRFLLFGSGDLAETSTEPEPANNSEWKFHPEDFEQ